MVEFVPDDIDFSAYLKETDAKRKIKGAELFIDDAKEKIRFRSTGKKTYLPWEKVNKCFEFRPAELTMWCGQNGHGKTDVTTQVALSLLGQLEKVCIASFELKPVTTIERMVRMYSGINIFMPEFQNAEGFEAIDQIYDEFGEWVTKKLWFYNQYGTTNPDNVYGLVKYCAEELGITHIFIDSLMKVVAGEDDYNAQKDFAAKLHSISQDHNIHIHLVHHLKKPSGGEFEKPDKHSTKGSGALTDIVDNLFMIWRNKQKENDARLNGEASTKKSEPDILVMNKKQRNYQGSDDGEPMIMLWREHESGQFVSQAGEPAQFFNNYPHRKTTW
jgi:twinkle protein